VALRLFATCWVIFALHFATNSVRELFPAITLGERLSFDVSDYVGMHPDIFVMPGRGAFIDNNPGASMLGAIPYALVRPIVDRIVERVQQARAMNPQPDRQYDSIYPMAREFYQQAVARGLDIQLGLAAAATQGLLMAPVSALSVVVMFRILLSRLGASRPALLLSLLYAFATPVLYRTAQLNHNILVAYCALFSFALLWRPWDDPANPGRPRYLLAGALAGWAVVLDYSGIVVPAALCLYAIARRSSLGSSLKARTDILQFCIGCGASLAVLAGYQWLAFGNPIFPAQHYMPPTPLSNYGYNGMGWPQPDLLWDTAFGLRFGLFAFAPILLLALYPPAWLDPRIRIIDAPEAWLCFGLSIGLFLFAAGNQYGRLQFNSGVRYVVPAVPFLFLIAAGVLRRLPFIVSLVIGVAATYWSWCLAMYRDVEQGAGVLEALRHISLEGPRLPWLTTLENLGYVSHVWTLPVLSLAACTILVIWTAGNLPVRRHPTRVTEPVLGNPAAEGGA
jgi:hypothetical protein